MANDSAAVKPAGRPASLFRVPNFRRLYLARVMSTAGDNLADVALAVFAYAASHNNPMAYGGVMAASYAAPLLVGFLASGWVDRWDKQRLMVALDLARALLIFSIPVVGQLWWAVGVVLVAQALNSYYMPVVRAVTPETVPNDRLLAANATLQNGVSAVQIPAYLAATAVVSRVGMAPAFSLDAVSFLLAALAIARMRLKPEAWRPLGTVEARPGFLAQFLEGLRYQRATPVVLRLLMVYMVSGIGLYGLNVAMAAWVARVGHEPLSALGEVFSALAFGSFVGSSAIGRRTLDPGGFRRAIAAGFLIMGGSLAVLLWAQQYVFLLAAVFVSGIGNAWAVVPLVTWIQQIVPPNMRGRVMVTRRMGIGAAAVVGSLATGALVAPFGVRPVLAGLLACLALAGVLTASRWVAPSAEAR